MTLWLRDEKLLPSDGDEYDEFGSSVALSARDTAIVGAPDDEDPNGYRAGSAYVFERSGWNWKQQTKLTAPDGDPYDRFGTSVALARNGVTALVAARDDEDPNGNDAGSAYVFTRSNGSWSRQQKLDATDGDSGDLFALSVALNANGNTALIGARDEDPNGTRAGSAYVFTRSNGNWSQQAKLTASDGDARDWFGNAVALDGSGDTALLGASGDEDPNGNDAGSAYMFTRSNGNWSQQAKLAAWDGDTNDNFGDSVALDKSGNTALVGAPFDEDPNGSQAGSAYVYTRAAGNWTKQAKLVAGDGDDTDLFGLSVALDRQGDTALVGTGDEDPNGIEAGSAYVFTRSNGNWSQQTKLAARDGDMNDKFGYSAALDWTGCTALLGAAGDEDPNGNKAGSAYVFGSIVFFMPLWPPYLDEEVRFDASYSTLSMESRSFEAYERDLDGDEEYIYEWDLDGDGEYEVVTEEPEVTHVFETAGEHTVSLRLRNKDGEVTDPTSRRVYVRRRVEIDVRPGEAENWIDTESEESVPVAVLDSSTFEGLERVDPSTARFGAADDVSLDELGAPYGGPRPVDLDYEDADGDEDPDLLFEFSQSETGFDPEDTTGKLAVLTKEGVPLVGTDSVVIDG